MPGWFFAAKPPGPTKTAWASRSWAGPVNCLTDIIVKGMKMRREDVYILNILRCRPPANRTPLPIEAANCREYLDRQLAIIQPEFICCLGAVAAQNLLGTDLSIGRLRGRIHDFHGCQGRLHLPPRLSLAKSRRQTVRLGRH